MAAIQEIGCFGQKYKHRQNLHRCLKTSFYLCIGSQNKQSSIP